MTDEDIPATIKICGVHEGEQLKYYCRNCKTPACKHCTLQDHQKHKCCPIEVIANEIKKSFVRKLAILRQRKAELSHDISNFEGIKNDITENHERVHGEIIQRFDSLAKIMESQKQYLLERADQLTNHKLAIVEKKLDNHRQTQESVDKNIDDIEMIYKCMEYEKVLYSEKCVSANIESIPFQNDQLPVDDDMEFLVSSSNEDFKTSLAKSHLVANGNIGLEYCTTALEPMNLKTGEKALITVRCKDSEDNEIKHGGQIIKAEFSGDATVADIVEINRNDGTHVIEFVPTGQGQLMVKFCINGQEASNCMLKTTVKNFKNKHYSRSLPRKASQY
jgi:hypothetical protein